MGDPDPSARSLLPTYLSSAEAGPSRPSSRSNTITASRLAFGSRRNSDDFELEKKVPGSRSGTPTRSRRIGRGGNGEEEVGSGAGGRGSPSSRVCALTLIWSDQRLSFGIGVFVLY